MDTFWYRSAGENLAAKFWPEKLGKNNVTLLVRTDAVPNTLEESSLLLLDYQSSLLLLDYQILLHWFFEISYPIPAAPYGLRFDASYPERFNKFQFTE